MRITERTLYATIEPIEKYFRPKMAEDIMRAAEGQFGGMYDLDFATFWACAGGDFSHLGDMKNPTVLQVYWVKRFNKFVEEITQALKGLTLNPTADESKAGQGLLQVTWGEGILVFLQQWFGLKSYKEAEKITMGELLIAKRAQYNQDLFRRRLAQIQTAKFKKK